MKPPASDPRAPRCSRCDTPVRGVARFCSTCGAPASHVGEDEDPLVGSVLAGRFQIQERIGEGGMAVVYRAEQTTVRRPIALKVLRERHARDRSQFARFQREARAVSLLNHPNTITVHDFGETEDQHAFIAMELVPGVNLGTLRKDGPLPWRRAIHIVQQVCASLQDAHDHDIVHRDLKSQNIMVGLRGDDPDAVKVLDFGIAKARFEDDDPLLTSPNITLGTPDVMAPEVLVGEPASPCSDIYALGVVLFELLAGRRLFPFEKVGEVVHAQMFAAPQAFSEINPRHDVPRDLEALVHEMLAKKPGDRPDSMREVAARLGRVAQARVEDASAPPGALTEPPRPSTSELPPALRRLIERIKGSLDFPAFAHNVAQLNALCDRDDVTPDQLADVVLRDYAITEKLLRMVNSAWYRRGNKPVSTISRAVVMLGFEQVRRIATSLMYWQHLESGEAQPRLDAAVRSLSSAVLARAFAGEVAEVDGEEAFVCAMFQSFGRQLVLHHLPAEAEAVGRAMAELGLAEPEAAQRVLGITFEQLGAGIAEHLSFPDNVIRTMQPMLPEHEVRPRTPAQKLASLATFSNGLAEALEAPTERRAEKMAGLQQRFGEGLSLTPARTQAVLGQAHEALTEMLSQLDLDVDRAPLLIGLQAEAQAGAAVSAPSRRRAPTPLAPTDPAAILQAAERQADELAEVGALNDVVTTVMEGMYRGGRFERVFFGLKDFKTGRHTARLALGGDARERLRDFAFASDGPPDLIRTAAARGTDLVVRDARLPTLRSRLPPWFTEHLDPGAFALYPVMVRGVCVGVLYGDTPRKGVAAPWLDAEVQAAVKTMRGHVVRALGALGRRGQR